MNNKVTFNDALGILNHLKSLGVFDKLHRAKILIYQANQRIEIANVYRQLLQAGFAKMEARGIAGKQFNVSENTVYCAQKHMAVPIKPIEMFNLKNTNGIELVKELINSGVLNALYKASVINCSVFLLPDMHCYYNDLIDQGIGNGAAIQKVADKFETWRATVSYNLSRIKHLN